MESDDADTRQGVCLGLSEVMASARKHHLTNYLNVLIPAVSHALCDELAEVREAAALAFDGLFSAVGGRAIDDILPGTKQKQKQKKKKKNKNKKHQKKKEETRIKAQTQSKYKTPKTTEKKTQNKQQQTQNKMQRQNTKQNKTTKKQQKKQKQNTITKTNAKTKSLSFFFSRKLKLLFFKTFSLKQKKKQSCYLL